MKVTYKWLILLAVTFSQFTFATEVLVWDKVPLKIRLEVGKEQLIEFPDNIELNMPQKMYNRLSINAAAGIAYITPQAPFPTARIEALLVTTNQKIFIDLFAVESDSKEPAEHIKIITKEESQEKEKARDKLFEQSASVTIKDLIQYASHDLFAPDRLKQTGKPITESKINKPLDLNLLFMGRSAGIFEIKPIKQYRTKKHTLTALLLTNKTEKPQMIVYRDLYPSFVAVSSQHIDVGPAKGVAESTVLYLVTDKPLTQYSIYAL